MAHQGKFYVVTGGSSGIGLATVQYLSSLGAKVGILDLSSPPSSNSFLFEVCNVMDPAAVYTAVEKLIKDANQNLNGVVNCAAFNQASPKLHEVSDEFYAKTMGVNIGGTFYVMKAAITHFLKNGGGGSIVNIASNAGLQGVPNFSSYSASKHAVIGLSKTAAKEYALDRIRVNVIAPGSIDTRMFWALFNSAEAAEPYITKQPIGRLITPLEVAKAIVFLLSDDSSAITGSVYTVDGGLMS